MNTPPPIWLKFSTLLAGIVFIIVSATYLISLLTSDHDILTSYEGKVSEIRVYQTKGILGSTVDQLYVKIDNLPDSILHFSMMQDYSLFTHSIHKGDKIRGYYYKPAQTSTSGTLGLIVKDSGIFYDHDRSEKKKYQLGMLLAGGSLLLFRSIRKRKTGA